MLPGVFVLCPAWAQVSAPPLAGETRLRGGPSQRKIHAPLIRQLAYDTVGKELDKLHLLTGNRPLPIQQLDKQHLNEPIFSKLA